MRFQGALLITVSLFDSLHIGSIRLVGSGVQFWQEPSLLLVFRRGRGRGRHYVSIFQGVLTHVPKKVLLFVLEALKLVRYSSPWFSKQTNIKADFTYSMDTILLGEKDSYKCLKRFYRFLKVHQYQLWPSWFTSQMYNVLDTILRQTMEAQIPSTISLPILIFSWSHF